MNGYNLSKIILIDATNMKLHVLIFVWYNEDKTTSLGKLFEHMT